MVVGNSLWQLIMQTDAISKTVLLLLLFMSIGMWTVFLCKAFLFNRKRRDIKALLAQIRAAHTVNELVVISQQAHGTLPGYFLAQSMRHLKGVSEDLFFELDKSNTQEVDYIRAMMEQEIDSIVTWEEEYIPFLSTSAVTSPLLGLLGTVWGLIHAFISISQTQMADIATVAPGIAEALITTLAGLIVAIPAVVMVNYLMAQVVHIEQQLVRITDQVIRIVQRSTSHKKENICVDLAVGEQKEVQQ